MLQTALTMRALMGPDLPRPRQNRPHCPPPPPRVFLRGGGLQKGRQDMVADKPWGAQTQRSLQHFSISKDLIPRLAPSSVDLFTPQRRSSGGRDNHYRALAKSNLAEAPIFLDLKTCLCVPETAKRKLLRSLFILMAGLGGFGSAGFFGIFCGTVPHVSLASRAAQYRVQARKGHVWNIRPLCAFAHHCGDLRCSIFERRTWSQT
jgi:hypothetical protein